MNSRSYFQYLKASKGRHGIHSPFVFDFVDKCLTTKVDKNFRKLLKNWTNEVKKDRVPFAINDLGAGSKQLKKVRSAAQLLANSSSKGLYGDVLWKIAHYYRPQRILELGTSLGTGTIVFKNGHSAANVLTVEGCENTQRKAFEQFDWWKLDGIQSICSDFSVVLPILKHQQFDLIFLDGNHQGKITLEYIEQLLSSSHSETIWIMDDIRWSDDMWQAWQQIVADKRFHVSIDLGRMGIFWQRPQQTKEHFTLRPIIWKTKLL